MSTALDDPDRGRFDKAERGRIFRVLAQLQSEQHQSSRIDVTDARTSPFVVDTDSKLCVPWPCASCVRIRRHLAAVVYQDTEELTCSRFADPSRRPLRGPFLP